MWSSLFVRPYWLHPRAQKKKKTFGVVPRSRAHIMEASDCVFELFGWRTVKHAPSRKIGYPILFLKPQGIPYFVNWLIIYSSCVHNVCVVFSSHPFWTSSSLDVPAGVTQEEGHTGFLIHLLSAVRVLIFLARRIQPFLFLVDREVEFCVLTI